MQLWAVTGVILLAGLSAMPAQAALVLNDLGGYSTNFNFLASSGTNNAWVNDRATQSAAGSPGWYWESTGDAGTYDANRGSGKPGKAYSYGSDGSSDRAMGSYSGQSAAVIRTAWGIVFHNDSGLDIGEVTVTFTGEEWRKGNVSTDALTFSYRTSDSEPTSLDPSAGVLPAGWIAVDDLTFNPPTDGSNSETNGNDPNNRELLTDTFSVFVPAGDYLTLRWYDYHDSLTEVGMAIDDLSVGFQVASVPEPSAFWMVGLAGVALGIVNHARKTRKRRRDASKMFSGSDGTESD